MWLTDGFSVTFFFGRWRGQCAYTLIHVQLPCMVIDLQDGGGGILNFRKLGKFGKLKIFIKVVGSISDHIRSHKWQPS